MHKMADKTETLEISNAELSTTEDVIKSNTKAAVAENLDLDKEKIIKQLNSAKNVEQRVKLFSKLTDTFWLEAIMWIIPWVWDVTPALISTCYLLAEWIHIWLPWRRCLQILWYQTADAVIGLIPGIWDVADFFFKWNKYSAKIFSKHLEKLKRAAKEKGISQEEIDNIWKKEERFIKTMDRYVDNESKKKKKVK